MSDTVLVIIVVIVSMGLGWGLGFITGWHWGQKAGEAKGIAWSTERLRQTRQEMKRP